MAEFRDLVPPRAGERIAKPHNHMGVPPRPVLPFVEAVGEDQVAARAARRAMDAAVALAYPKRELVWLQVELTRGDAAGETAELDEDALEAFKFYQVGMLGPLPDTAVHRQVLAELRRSLDLYAGLRWFYEPGQHKPALTLLGEHSEGRTASLGWAVGSAEASALTEFLQVELREKGIRFPASTGWRLQPHSAEGSTRLLSLASHRARQLGLGQFTRVRWPGDGWGDALELDPPGLSRNLHQLLPDLLEDASSQTLIAGEGELIDLLAVALAPRFGGVAALPGASQNPETGHALFESNPLRSESAQGLAQSTRGALLAGAQLLELIGWNEAVWRLGPGLRWLNGAGPRTAAAAEPEQLVADLVEAITAADSR